MVTKHPPILVTYYSKHLFLFYALCGGGTALHKHLGAQSDGGSILKVETSGRQTRYTTASVMEALVGRTSQLRNALVWSETLVTQVCLTSKELGNVGSTWNIW